MANEVAVTTITGESEAPPRVSEWHRMRRVFLGRPLVVFGLVVIVIFILIAIFSPLIAPYDPF